ncbi:MAG: Fic family protein [Bacteroidetes bacterium]|nr:Fic family protein [Bacteroidota bacterium]MCA6443296.1 Fic family protein [Bacteroidota bacterium]
MKINLKIISTGLIEEYLKLVSSNLKSDFDILKDAEISTETFNFYTSVSAIASSRIEGEQMEVDSYIKHKMLNIEYQPNLVEKPNDLYKAYIFAQENELTSNSFLKAHSLLSAHLLPEIKQGIYRTGNMVVMEHKTGRIQYEAALVHEVQNLMDLLWQDIEQLKKESLSIEEIFYFASFIHIVFVNIHPFEDGNGRAGRLLEKWFVAQKLGKKAWFMQSELNYYNNVNDYYKNLNRLGMFYEQLDYSKSLAFLLMLPNSLNQK